MTEIAKRIFEINGLFPIKEELDAKCMEIAGETTRKYFTEGPPLKNWTLGFNITLNLLRQLPSPLSPRTEPLTEEILDYDELVKNLALARISNDNISIRGGNHSRHTYFINEEELFISPHKFIDELASKDRQSSKNNSPRSLFSEIVAHDSVVEKAIKDGYTKNQVLDIHPLSKDEVVMTYYHAGGYILSSPYAHMSGATDIPKETGYRVFIPSYRYSPENPFPAPIHDGYIFFQYVLSLGYKPENIIAMGCSAGGNLCMNVLQLLKESYKRNASYAFLSQAGIDDAINMTRLYVGPRRKFDEEFKKLIVDPLVSPLYADMDGWPQMYILSGESELPVDDIDYLAKKIGAKETFITGVDHPGFDTEDKHLYNKFAGMVHNFILFDDAEEKHSAIKGIGHFTKRLAQKH
ncbi:hypothetical protein BB558_002331 [Smittium angustum]|uniref:Alpha/beta hydrolase fold-3 domain-containing protein n=1 Tax=Smittium angustum TaxID=133377 RepID=A0A2U1J977_SMIAN|nr:hypothetical protein BB558_002331 [Smittium angustum]